MVAPVTSEASRLIAAPLDQVWDAVEAMDLTTIFTASVPLPGIVAVEDQIGSWDRHGQSRHLRLSDGTRLREEITQAITPDGVFAGFTYEVTGYSGLIGHLTAKAIGRWEFETTGEGTQTRWHYAYAPKSGLTRPFIAAINGMFWRRYMDQALGRIETMITGAASAN